MPFTYQRVVRFQDTDAAGVVYFANLLAICHEAYEASLMAAEIELQSFFRAETIAVPIVHAQIDFRQPLHCGDRLQVELTPRRTGTDQFEIDYSVFLEGRTKPASQAQTRHVCIDPVTRQRQDLSPELVGWLSQFGQG